MRKILFLSALFVFFGCFLSSASAQTESAIKPSLISGEVTTISADKIVLQTTNGAADYILSDKTVYKRVPPENPKTQVDSKFSEISVGDKVVVSVIIGADKKAQPVRTVYLMSKADITQRQSKDLERWRTRGISGRITAIDPNTKAITVTTRTVVGTKDTILTPKENALFLRYAPDSVNFNEAKKVSFAEINVGDMLRAVGDKSADGATFAAEEILTGAFQTTAGTITAVNAEKNEVTINNIQTKKDVTIVVGNNSVLKQFPAEMAQRMAQMQMAQAVGGAGGGFRPPNQQGGAQPNPQGQAAQQGGGMRPGGGSIDDMLERFPNITVADLKVGEMIAVSSTKTANVERITAIKLLSGVEPFLKIPQTANNNGGRRGGADSGFTIPGLDGFGGP